jgi:hypothetical protein
LPERDPLLPDRPNERLFESPSRRERPICDPRDPDAAFPRFEFESIVANAPREFDEPLRWLKKLLRRPPLELPCRTVVLLRSDRANELDERDRDRLLELFCCDPKFRLTPLERLIGAG